jgi:hypothetical protein
MGETPAEETSEHAEQDENTAKLELPKLSLPRFGRRRKNRGEPPVDIDDDRRAPEPVEETTATVVADRAEPEADPAPAADLYREGGPLDEQIFDEQFLDEQPPLDEQPLAEEPEVEREPFRLPAIPGRLAAAITGLVVGAFGAMLTYVSLKGCDALRGTETCGGTGLGLLLVILVLMVLLGAVLLAAWQISDPRSTSFLAVGVLSVIVMLTLMQQLYSPWMFLIVPVVSAGSYVLSHWVTTAFIEAKPEDGPEHDVR